MLQNHYPRQWFSREKGTNIEVFTNPVQYLLTYIKKITPIQNPMKHGPIPSYVGTVQLRTGTQPYYELNGILSTLVFFHPLRTWSNLVLKDAGIFMHLCVLKDIIIFFNVCV